MSKDTIKILTIITSSDTGGAQKYVHDLQATLDPSQFSFKILYGERNTLWLSNQTLPHLFFYNDIRAVFELLQIFKQEKPHIIHLNSSKAGVIGAFAFALYKLKERMHLFEPEGSSEPEWPKSHTLPKLVFTAHGWVFNPTNKIILPIRWFYIFLHKLAGFAMDKIITVSHADKSLAKRYHIVPEHKLTTIHNGIDYTNLKFLDKVSARKKLLSRIVINDESKAIQGFWVGSIGRLTKEKDYETLIQAASYIPHIYFFILGTGELLLKYRKIIIERKLNHSFFIIGESEGASQFLSAFDIFTLSSVKEGLPYALLEACAAKLPSVITNAGGMPEVITNEVSGFIVPQKNPKLLAEKIKILSENNTLRKKFSEEAFSHMQQEFSLVKMVEKTQTMYKNIIQNI